MRSCSKERAAEKRPAWTKEEQPRLDFSLREHVHFLHVYVAEENVRLTLHARLSFCEE